MDKTNQIFIHYIFDDIVKSFIIGTVNLKRYIPI